MRILLIIASLFAASSTFAIELDQAVILDHRSEVYGSDATGKAIDGHLSDEDASDSDKKNENIATSDISKK